MDENIWVAITNYWLCSSKKIGAGGNPSFLLLLQEILTCLQQGRKRTATEKPKIEAGLILQSTFSPFNISKKM